MKVFKRIWYCLLAALLIVSLSLGINSAYSVGSSTGLSEAALSSAETYVTELPAENQQNYIMNLLSSAGYKRAMPEAVADEDDELNYNTQTEGDRNVPSVALHQQTINAETNEALSENMDLASNTTFSAVGIEPSNIVAYIPGVTANSDVVLFYTRYNRSHSSDYDNIPVSALIANAINEVSLSAKNGIIFLFADASEGDNFGLYNFLYRFKGFDGATERIKAAVDLDSLSSAGAMNLIDVKGNYSFISDVNAVAGKGMSSSVIAPLYKSSVGKTDSDLFSCAYARIANSSGLNFNKFSGEEKFSAKTLANYSNVIYNLASRFADYDLATAAGDEKVFCFNLFGLSMALPYMVGYIFASLIIVFLAAIIIVNMKKKAFNLVGAGKGFVVQFLSLALTAIIMMLLYYIMLLVLSLFTIIPVEAIASLRYSGPGIIACMLLLTIPVITGSQMIFKKIFACKPADVTRGNIIIASILGIIGGFLPHYGFVFAILAVLELIVMLISVFAQQKYFEKHNDSLGKLFLYILPVIIVLPVFINILATVSSYSYLMYLPLLCTAFALMIGFATPYIGLIKPSFQKIVDKLPKKAVRVQKTEKAMVEDRAKKGKFTEQTVTKYEVNYVDRKYKNRYLVIAVAVIMVIVNLFVGGIGVTMGKNIVVNALGMDAFKQNSMVYVYDANEENSYFEIYDPLVYKEISAALEGFEWDPSQGAYVKAIAKISGLVQREPDITRDSEDKNRYQVIVSDSEQSKVKLTVSGISSVSGITVRSVMTDDEFTIEPDGKSQIELDLPKSFGDFELIFDGLDDSSALQFDYIETLEIDADDLNSRYDSSDWNVIEEYFGNSLNIYGGSIIKLYKSL